MQDKPPLAIAVTTAPVQIASARQSVAPAMQVDLVHAMLLQSLRVHLLARRVAAVKAAATSSCNKYLQTSRQYMLGQINNLIERQWHECD